MFQVTPSLATTCQVPADICGGVGSQESIRVRPAEFIRPQKIIIWLCEGRAVYQWCVREKLPLLEAQVQQAEPPIVRRVGLVDLLCGGVSVSFWGKEGGVTLTSAPFNKVTNTPETNWISTHPVQAADSLAGCEFHRMG